MTDQVSADVRAALEYQQLLHEHEQAFLNGDRGSAMGEFREDAPQADEFLQRCAAHMPTDRAAAVVCAKLTGVAGHLMHVVFPNDMAIEWREIGVRAIDTLLNHPTPLPDASRAELTRDLVSHLVYLGAAHLRQDNRARSDAATARAAELADHMKDDPSFAASVLTQLAMAEIDNDPAAAWDKLQRARAVAQDHPQLLGPTENTAGVAAKARGDHAVASDCFRNAARAFEAAGDRSGQATVLANLSEMLVAQGELADARVALNEARDLAAGLNEPGLRALLAVRDFYLTQAEPGPAASLDGLEDAMKLFGDAGDKANQRQIAQTLVGAYRSVVEQPSADPAQPMTALSRWARALMILEQDEERITILNQLLTLALDEADTGWQVWARVHLGRLWVDRRDHAAAVEPLEAALPQLRERSASNHDVYEALSLLGQAYRHTHRPDDAIRCYSEAEVLGDIKREQRLRARGNRALVQAERGEHTTAAATFGEIAQTYREIGDLRLAAHATFNQAYVHYLAKDLQRALKLGNAAYEVLERLNDRRGMGILRTQLDAWRADEA